jgi:Ca-activated chloride channel family protein
MSFARVEWLNALFLIPLIAVLFLVGARRRRRALVDFAGERLSESLAPGRSWRKGLLKAALRTAGVALLVFGLAGPQIGSQLVKVEREGIDLVIALDASLSMLAEDMKPNRLERAKREIVDLIDGLRGDRVGVVVFAGNAFVLCPLTVDYDAALMLVQTADVTMLSEPGTAIDQAIERSLDLFPDEGKADRLMILVTDGEDHEGDPVAQAEKAADRNVRIYTIGIGSPSGELIPIRGTGGSIGGYKKDDAGETVLTRLDEPTLRKIARATGGQYLPATREGLELKVLYREIAGMEKAAIKGEFLERRKERFSWFLAGAFFLLVLDFLTVPRSPARPGAGRRILHTGAGGIALLVCASLLATPANASKIDRGRVKSGNAYYRSGDYPKALVLYKEALGDTIAPPGHSEGVFYNEANTLHMLGRYPEALEKYHASLSEDTAQTGRMLYNRGNTLLAMGSLTDAVESYIQALRYMPDDADARHNLELALRMMEEQERLQAQDQQDPESGEGSEDPQQQDSRKQDAEQQKREEDSQRDRPDPQQPDSTQAQQPDSAQSRPQTGEQDTTMTRPELPDSAQLMVLSREDALRLLKLLEEQEKELQKEKRKAAFTRVPRSGKDW